VIVPDVSAAVLLFGDPAGDPRVEAATQVLQDDPDWMVPEHWRVEFLSTIRGLLLGGVLDAADAEAAIGWLRRIGIAVAPTDPLVPRIWELRTNLSAYDAGYVAVAETHDLTLVTADARLARAGVARCPVRLVS